MKCTKCDSESEDVLCSQYKTEDSIDFQVLGKNLSVPLSLWWNHSETTKHQMRQHDNEIWFSDLYIRKEDNTCPSAGNSSQICMFYGTEQNTLGKLEANMLSEPMEQPAALVSALKCEHPNRRPRIRRNWINGLCIFIDEFSVWAEEDRFLPNH